MYAIQTLVFCPDLQTFTDARLEGGVSKSTENRDMAAVKQVLNAAARWFHENGQLWLAAVPEGTGLQVAMYCDRKTGGLPTTEGDPGITLKSGVQAFRRSGVQAP